ncbi:MAG: hypothetical protein WD468_00075 [Pirellulales bacterium]
MATGMLPPSSARAAGRGASALDAERFIDRQIDRTGKYVKTVDLLSSLLTLAAGTIAYFLAVVAIDHWVVPGGLGTLGRSVVLIAWLIVAGGYLVRRVAPPILRRINPLYAATTIEQTSASFKNSLLTSLELREDRAGVDETIFRSVERQAAGTLRTVPVEATVDRSGLIRVGYVLAGLLLAAALYKAISPKDPLQTLLGVAAPWADVPVATRVAINDVRPGNATAVRGSKIEISAEITGLDADEPVVLRYSSVDGQITKVPVPMGVPEGGYRHVCSFPPVEAGLTQDVIYWIEAGDARSANFRVIVESAPTITVESIGYDYPAYTSPTLRDARDTRSADIHAIEGTKVTIHAVANQPIASAHVDFGCDGKADARMTVKQETATYTFPLEFADRAKRTVRHKNYQILFTNRQGQVNARPAQHSIGVTADLSPEVEILAPTQPEIQLAENGSTSLQVRAIDPDFKLGDVRIKAAGAKGPLLDHPLLSIEERPWQGQFVRSYRFAPREHGLKAGDVVTYRAMALDNRTPQANKAETAEFRIRIVAPPEPDKQRKTKPDERPKPDEKKSENPPPDEQPDGDKEKKPDEKKPGDAEQKPDEQQPGGQKPDEKSEKKPGEKGEKKDDSKAEGQQPGEKRSPDKQSPDKKEQDQQGSKDESGNQGSQGSSKAKGGKPSPSKDAGSGDNQGQGEKQQSDGASGDKTPGEDAGEGTDGSKQQDRGPGSARGQRESSADDAEAFEQLIKERNAQDAKGRGKKSDSADPSGDAAKDAAAEPAKGKGDPSEKQEKGARPEDGEGDDAKLADDKGEKGGAKKDSQGADTPDRQSTPDGKSGEGLGDKTRAGQEEKKNGTPGEAKPEEVKKKEPSDQEGGQEKGGHGDRGAGDLGKPSDTKEGAPKAQDQNIPGNKPSPVDDKRKPANDDNIQSPAIGKKQSKGTQGETDGDRSGGGGKGGGQKANQAGKDSAGSNTSSDDGANKSNEPGKGETGTRGGQDEKSAGKTGQAGDEKGKGSQSKKGDSSSGKGKGNGPGDGKNGTNNGKTGDGPLGTGSGPGKDKEPSDEEGSPTVPDKPNLEDAEKATDLALDHLRDRMKQGDEQALLEKLGWTREDADQFLRKWDQLKREAKGSGATAENARKRLQQDLQSLGLRRGGDRVRGADAAKDDRRGLATGTNVPPPPEYADRLRAYQKGTGEAGPTAARGE